jgi:hypothetical protein
MKVWTDSPKASMIFNTAESRSMTDLVDTSMHSLKKSISGWIISLQGTGNQELNKVVNELHSLECQISNPVPDNQVLRSSVRSVVRQVRTAKDRQSDPYYSRLVEVEKRLTTLTF